MHLPHAQPECRAELAEHVAHVPTRGVSQRVPFAEAVGAVEGVGGGELSQLGEVAKFGEHRA